MHAGAEALHAPGFAAPAEVDALLAGVLNDASTICSFSRFNQYWIVQGLAAAGALDKAMRVIQLCWGAELDLGASCFFEVSDPAWATIVERGPCGPGDLPWSYNGNTSLCHA